MDTFASDLRRALVVGPSRPAWGMNPLVAIGLSEALFDLGLSTDQLYAAVRSYVRQLLAQVHPDRRPENVTAARQAQIMDAFGQIDDRAVFVEALAEFRELRIEDRREVRQLRVQFDAAQEQLDALRHEVTAHVQTKAALRDETVLVAAQRREAEQALQTARRVATDASHVVRSRRRWIKLARIRGRILREMAPRADANPVATDVPLSLRVVGTQKPAPDRCTVWLTAGKWGIALAQGPSKPEAMTAARKVLQTTRGALSRLKLAEKTKKQEQRRKQEEARALRRALRSAEGRR